MLLNGSLYNSEAWHDVTEKDIKLLEKVDEALLRGVLGAHSKIPIEALYLETATVPIRFVISSRRLMYLHCILQRSKEELVRKVYDAQKENTTAGDFCELVECYSNTNVEGILKFYCQHTRLYRVRFRPLHSYRTCHRILWYLNITLT